MSNELCRESQKEADISHDATDHAVLEVVNKLNRSKVREISVE